MTSPSPVGRLAAIAFLLLVLLTAWLLVSGPRAAPQPAPGIDPELLAELRELRRSNERTAEILELLESVLGERLAAPLTTGEPARSAVGDRTNLPGAEDFANLAASLDALRATFERESGETQELIRSAPASRARRGCAARASVPASYAARSSTRSR